ncbi:hypothetical protein D9611_000751 [Ephemerocybe angulata]|uniref:Ribonuclease H1 N-terminal domain-containing protein n=1 Tax=Ephemerocybe angulata TaxID=980116 RepID=A0A8H5F7Z5_9AGAR|nr:hypothetical protein D9611_000751 [Tulosesus angulatus]
MNQASRGLRGVTLTSPMRDLLGLLIRSIDLRFGTIRDAGQREQEYHPETCGACEGTGFVMVPRSAGDGSYDGDDGALLYSSDEDGVSASSNSPAGIQAAATPAGASGVSAPDVSSLAPALASVHLMTPPPTLPTLPTLPIASSSAPVVISPSGLAPPVVTLNQAAVQPEDVPDMSTVIPGFNSLGSNTVPPVPAQAVFTGVGEERYYVVTKGIRVGVFGGWANTSPYVTGVASASFSRHRTLQSAYTAYGYAWSRGAVSIPALEEEDGSATQVC